MKRNITMIQLVQSSTPIDMKPIHPEQEMQTDTDVTLSDSSEYSVYDSLEEESALITWKIWEMRFKKSTEDLLIDNVDLETERHMSLQPFLSTRARMAQDMALKRRSPASVEYWIEREQAREEVSPVQKVRKVKSSRRRVQRCSSMRTRA